MTSPRHTPRPLTDIPAVRDHYASARASCSLDILQTAVADLPVLLAEIDRLGSLLALTRVQHAQLLAAAQATVAADHDGEHDSLLYLRDELDASGQLRPTTLLASDSCPDADLAEDDSE